MITFPLIKMNPLVTFKKALTLSLLLTVFLSGCVTNGAYFPSDLSWIQLNKTNQNDVRKLLGEPHSAGSSSGAPTWIYGYYKYKLIGTSATKELKFFWNDDKTVKTYSLTSEKAFYLFECCDSSC